MTFGSEARLMILIQQIIILSDVHSHEMCQGSVISLDVCNIRVTQIASCDYTAVEADICPHKLLPPEPDFIRTIRSLAETRCAGTACFMGAYKNSETENWIATNGDTYTDDQLENFQQNPGIPAENRRCLVIRHINGIFTYAEVLCTDKLIFIYIEDPCSQNEVYVISDAECFCEEVSTSTSKSTCTPKSTTMITTTPVPSSLKLEETTSSSRKIEIYFSVQFLLVVMTTVLCKVSSV